MNQVRALAKMIDHALLHPTLTDQQMREGCQMAMQLNVASVCIKPYAIPLAVEELSGSDVMVCTVIGFPHGNSRISLKESEAEEACRLGAVELDMVVNVGKVRSSKWEYVYEEIRVIQDVCRDNETILKVIFENDFLPDDASKIRLCEICSEIGVAFVKTSTGFGFAKDADGRYDYRGATDHDLKLMRTYATPEVQLKASGGIRTLADALRVKELGATRIGASATKVILAEARRQFEIAI
ncbi:MAG: deoxyribose-phosphate aldolase [Bacteroidota bacterium]